jgi:hypothetical protein
MLRRAGLPGVRASPTLARQWLMQMGLGAQKQNVTIQSVRFHHLVTFHVRLHVTCRVATSQIVLVTARRSYINLFVCLFWFF